MGYHTEFSGSFKLDKRLDPLHKEFLEMFAETRRMQRNPLKLEWMRKNGMGNTRCFELMDKLNLSLDKYCGTGDFGQDRDPSITEYNYSPAGQPGLWCSWVPSEDGTEIVWNGAEKFYDYVSWIEFLIEKFLKPWGYKVNGMVSWRGEEHSDIGVIEVVDNVVTTHEGETIQTLKRTKVDDTPKPLVVTKLAKTPDADIVFDIVKIRNELAKSKKGTAVACKKLDELIKKYI